MAYPFREDWLQQESELKRKGDVSKAMSLGPIAWLAYVDTGRRCTWEQAAEAVETAASVFSGEEVTVVSYLQMVEYTRELLEAVLRDTTQSGSVDQAGGEQGPAPS